MKLIFNKKLQLIQEDRWGKFRNKLMIEKLQQRYENYIYLTC